MRLVAALAWLFRPAAVAVDLVEVERGPLMVSVSDEGETRVRDMYVVSAPVPGLMRRIELDVEGPAKRRLTPDDLADACVFLLKNYDSPELINIGSGTDVTIRELAELVVEIAGTGVEIVQARPLPQDDPLQRQPDITLAREKLGWEPKIALREGLQRTVDWFRDADLSQYKPPTPHY
mgnify:CR=1 FL=1